jgi:putative sterol carrier protein
MTAAQLIQSLPDRLKEGAGKDVDITYHFKITGTNGGDFTVKVKDGICTVEKGLSGEPKCEIVAKDTDYEDVELGRTNPQMAVLFGKVKVSNVGSLMKFVEMFERARP